MVLVIALAAFGGALLLNFLEPVVHRRRRQAEAFIDSQPVSEVFAAPPRARPAPPAANETATFHYRQILNAGGLLGLLYLPLLLAYVPINARIVSEGFEVLLDRPGTALFEVEVLGFVAAITEMHLYGLAVTLGLLLLGAACGDAAAHPTRWRWIALGAALALVGFEVLLAVLRGILLANDAGRDPWLLIAANGLQGLVAASVELVAGYWAVDRFLVPLARLIGWLAFAPLRLVGPLLVDAYAWLRRPGRPPGILSHAAIALDAGLFDPLRGFDARVLRARRPENANA